MFTTYDSVEQVKSVTSWDKKESTHVGVDCSASCDSKLQQTYGWCWSVRCIFKLLSYTCAFQKMVSPVIVALFWFINQKSFVQWWVYHKNFLEGEAMSLKNVNISETNALMLDSKIKRKRGRPSLW